MDQYGDGVAASVWDDILVDVDQRLANYSGFLVDFLRNSGCHRVLDVACGTGIDSVMLLENGFQVTSVDISDKMLKYALKKREDRRTDKAFDQWVIKQANWLTLHEDVAKPDGGYDALLCIGNSFPMLLGADGDLATREDMRLAVRNFFDFLRPGGFLIVDHRNYDNHTRPKKSIYYSGKNIQSNVAICTSTKVKIDYTINLDAEAGTEPTNGSNVHHCSFLIYPHKLESVSGLLEEAFGDDCRHEIYGDYKPLDSESNPGFYIHIVQKSA